MHALQRAVLEAPAKVNLYLDIVGRREDGYHQLETVMQAVSLRDLVVVGRCAGAAVRVTCSSPAVPEDDRNLAARAAQLFLRQTGSEHRGWHIHIDKVIPPEAGLGGGSANAAAVLVALNHLLRAEISQENLRRMGLALGADVPFALQGGCAVARGVGEKLTPCPGLPGGVLVLAKPVDGVSTAEAYARYDRLAAARHGQLLPMEDALRAGDLRACGRAMFNAFEQVLPPEPTAALKRAMLAAGADGAALSGSGSAVAGLFAQPPPAYTWQALRRAGHQVFVTRPLSHGAKILFAD